MKDEKKEELQYRIQDVQHNLKDFKIERDQTYTYFLGVTGSGKSTSINYLLAENILEFKQARGGRYQIKYLNGNYPQIGHSQ